MSAGKPQYILQLGLKTYQGGMCLSEEAIPKSVSAFPVEPKLGAGVRSSRGGIDSMRRRILELQE
jgi:hypothetical protein